MKEWIDRLRWWLAYRIAPDLIDDLEERFSGLLWHVTDGLLSKTGYSLSYMISAADDCQQRLCEECEYYPKEKPIELEEGNAEGSVNGVSEALQRLGEGAGIMASALAKLFDSFTLCLSDNKRVIHLARCHKKWRVRKKNAKRMKKWYKKEGKRRCLTGKRQRSKI